MSIAKWCGECANKYKPQSLPPSCICTSIKCTEIFCSLLASRAAIRCFRAGDSVQWRLSNILTFRCLQPIVDIVTQLALPSWRVWTNPSSSIVKCHAQSGICALEPHGHAKLVCKHCLSSIRLSATLFLPRLLCLPCRVWPDHCLSMAADVYCFHHWGHPMSPPSSRWTLSSNVTVTIWTDQRRLWAL